MVADGTSVVSRARTHVSDRPEPTDTSLVTVFFLRHYNDIDHIVPVIWRCLERGESVTAVLLDPEYDVASDLRLKFLSEYSGFDLQFVHEFLGLDRAATLFRIDGKTPRGTVRHAVRHALRRTGLTMRRAAAAIEELDPQSCVFEWSKPLRPTHAEFFLAAERLDVDTVCLPHGLNIYLNHDINPYWTEIVAEGSTPMTARDGFDVYVTQSHHHKEHDVRFGKDPENYLVLGSTRYYPEWQEINQELHPTFESRHDPRDRAKTVFMLPHWEYNVDKETTLALLTRMADSESIHLVIKEHTRGDSLPDRVYRTLADRESVELVADVPSVSLIEWSDAVVNFGSSIGIEALLQDRHLVNPSYLHSNRTVFEETGSAHEPASNEEVTAMLERLQSGDLDPIPEERVRELYRTVVYGGREEFDVLETYYDLVRREL